MAVGDPLEVEVTEDAIGLKPKKLTDASQTYFWTSEWQEKEHRVSEEFRKGRYDTAKDNEGFFKKLKSPVEKGSSRSR